MPKLSFSFHKTYHESKGPLDKLSFRLQIAAFAVEYFAQNFSVSSTRADYKSRSSNILCKPREKWTKIWVEFGSWTEVSGRSRQALRWRSDRVSPIRMCWSRPTKKHTAESGRETRCMCSRFNPHTKGRASKDKKQSRNFDFSDPSEHHLVRRRND